MQGGTILITESTFTYHRVVLRNSGASTHELPLTKAIVNDIVVLTTKVSHNYKQYSYEQNGHVDSLRAILVTIHMICSAARKCC